MAVNNSKPAVRKLHKGRVCGCFTVLIVLIMIISTLISACRNNHADKNNSSSDVDVIANNAVTTSEQVRKKYLICIDPGHGGDDPGSNYGDREEKVDNLKYATLVYEELQKSDKVDVIITRTSDVAMTNKERAQFANDAGADLYLALHRNHTDDSTAHGVEIWIQKESDVADEVLGYKLLQNLETVGISENRGVHTGYTNQKQENFEIIEFTDMTCCIVELGFISNDDDNALFDKNYKEYAKVIAETAEQMCLDKYFDKNDGSGY